MSRLEIGYEHASDDGLGRLTVAVETQGFSGAGGFWAQPSQLEGLARRLEPYPLVSDPVIERWGFDSCEGEDVVVGLEVKPADGLGNLLVIVEIADEYDSRRRLRTDFRTSYMELGRFRDELVDVARLRAQTAVLEGG
jgi:hypothetical protein